MPHAASTVRRCVAKSTKGRATSTPSRFRTPAASLPAAFRIANQFGNERLDTAGVGELCIPSQVDLP
jgi:hypothetical protein